MPERIGVFLCECGPNIKEALDLDEVAEFAGGIPNVYLTRSHRLLCSEEGKRIIRHEIETHGLTRVVIAACSPKEHEATFREVCRLAGLNPFLLQIANVREHCAWVLKDKGLATAQAKAIIRAAVERVIHNEAIETKEIECEPDVLVVGAGVAGMSAALTLAQKGRKVYLIEKAPCIGGKAVRYEKVFPDMECASCILDPMMDQVLHNEGIELFPMSQAIEVLGSYGNFVVKVLQRERFIDDKTCIGCGVCQEACPVETANEFNEGLDKRKAVYIPYPGCLPNVPIIDKGVCLRFQGKECNACKEACHFGSIDFEEVQKRHELRVGAVVLATGFDLFDVTRAPQYGYGRIPDVYTSLEFESLLSSTGPTGGKILLRNGKAPRRITFVHCVGSRSIRFNEYCSGVCCLYSLKFASQSKEKLPETSITMLLADLCLPGKKSQAFFDKVSGVGGAEFAYTRKLDSVEVLEEDGDILIKYIDTNGSARTIGTDMVVLAPAMEAARDAGEISEVFDIPRGEDGFFAEESVSLGPVSTVKEGIFIAGCAQGPKEIQGSVAQGQAAGGLILSRLLPGEKVLLEPAVSEIDEASCSGCRICLGLCCYRAITHDDVTDRVTVDELLCRGCGVCAAACPSGAIKAKTFSDNALSSEIRGLVGEKNIG